MFEGSLRWDPPGLRLWAHSLYADDTLLCGEPARLFPGGSSAQQTAEPPSVTGEPEAAPSGNRTFGLRRVAARVELDEGTCDLLVRRRPSQRIPDQTWL